MPGLLNGSPAPEYGRRLIPNVIDERARQEPTKLFAAIPRSKDLADGYVDVTYASLANAVNRASWWLYESMGHVDTSEVFAYLGPNDLRYPIFLTAAIKCGYRMLLPSPRNSVEYQQTLLKNTGCETVFCASNFMAKVTPIIEDLDVCCNIAPELDELLNQTTVKPFPYVSTYEEAKKDQFMILHTSGSTGPPKPISFTIESTTTEDTHRLLEDPSRRLWWRLFDQSRFFLGMPCYHSAGVWFSLFLPVWFDSIVVFGPSNRPLTAAIAAEVQKMTPLDGGFYPPSILEEIFHNPEALQGIRDLKFVAYGGGLLSKAVGDQLSRMTTLHNFIGFTEASAPPRYIMEPEVWDYFKFHPASGFTTQHLHDNLHKMVIRRTPKYEFTQAAFRVFPELDEYIPGDVLTPHPERPDLWTHRGRTDDLIVLSTGEKFNPNPAELLLKACPVVTEVLIAGDGRPQAALIVERHPTNAEALSTDEIIQAVWPYVQKANDTLATQARLIKAHIIVAPTDIPFTRSPKGTVQRKATVATFESLLSALYAQDSHTRSILSNGSKPRAESGARRVSFHTTPTVPPAAQTRLPRVYLDNHQPYTPTEELRTIQAPPSPTFGTRAIRSVLSSLCGMGNIDENLDLFDLGMDSMQALQVSNALQDISTTWPKDKASALKLLYSNSTIRGLANAIGHPNSTPVVYKQSLVTAPLVGINGNPAATPTTAIKESDAIEALVQKYTADLSEISAQRPITVALTGGTGSIGSHIFDRLTKDPNVAKIICLGRSVDGREAQEAASARNGLTPAIGSGSKPIQYFQIDLSQPYLGLKPHQYATIQRETDVILHTAWKVDFLQAAKSFENTHIAGVRHLVDLAASSERQARIVFVSSVASVLGWKEERSVPEEAFQSVDIAGKNGYGQSKHIAERILYEASKKAGIRATIVRLGQISGPTDAGSGIWNSSDWVPQILKTSKSLGAVPKSVGMADNVDWVPIDKISGIVMDLVQQGFQDPTRFQVYHAVNPNSVSWGSLLPAVCHRLGSNLELVSYQQWLSKLRAEAEKTDGGDVASFPAIRLMGWLHDLDVPRASLPTLSVDKTTKSSSTLAKLGPITGLWMENWMSAWGL